MRKYIALAFLVLTLPVFAVPIPDAILKVTFDNAQFKQVYGAPEVSGEGEVTKEMPDSESWTIKSNQQLTLKYYPHYPPFYGCTCEIIVSVDANHIMNASAKGPACVLPIHQAHSIAMIKLLSPSECPV